MTTRRNTLFVVVLMIPLFFGACQAKEEPAGTQPAEPSFTPQAPPLTDTPEPAHPATATPSPYPSIAPTLTASPTISVCSPLAGYGQSELEGAIYNPFNPPAAGLDGPHQGVDFADLEPANRYARAGWPVQAVLAGKIAAVIANRFPYGNALLIETALTEIPSDWLQTWGLPPVQPPQTPHPALTCPDLPLPGWDMQTRSLYVLYAHLQAAPQLHSEDVVECGQTVGNIGSSGNALNPHLHLETRVGPTGARFGSLAHYDSSASPEEMANYCTWRVRGVFQLIDPALLIDQVP